MHDGGGSSSNKVSHQVLLEVVLGQPFDDRQRVQHAVIVPTGVDHFLGVVAHWKRKGKFTISYSRGVMVIARRDSHQTSATQRVNILDRTISATVAGSNGLTCPPKLVLLSLL